MLLQIVYFREADLRSFRSLPERSYTAEALETPCESPDSSLRTRTSVGLGRGWAGR